MKQITIVFAFILAIVYGQSYTCTSYPTTASPSYWNCAKAFTNGYSYTRSSTNYWKICTNDGTVFKSSPTVGNACPVPAGTEIPKITATVTVTGANCTNGPENKRDCIETVTLFPYTPTTYPYTTKTDALANGYSYYKESNSWYRVDLDVVTNAYVIVLLPQIPAIGLAPNVYIPKVPVINVMSTHPCYSINTAAEAVAAGFKHYYRQSSWYHIYSAGTTAKVTKDNVAPATCTSTASSNIPSSINCNSCLSQLGSTTGECWKPSATSTYVTCCAACDPLAVTNTFVPSETTGTGCPTGIRC